MMVKAKRKKLPPPAQLYKGAETCDLKPEWLDKDVELVSLLEACHQADPDDLTPQLVMADFLGERADPREKWVRVGCSLWDKCRTLKPGRKNWDFDKAKESLSKVTGTTPGWRMACLWGNLISWHCPSGWDSECMGRTWVDERVKVVNRCLWWWCLGFLGKPGEPWNQANAAENQASAAWHQASAAWHQAYAAGNQANVAGYQAGAAWHQASAAWHQAYAAGNQAYAAGNQAEAAGNQAEVWRFARASWELCLKELPTLEI